MSTPTRLYSIVIVATILTSCGRTPPPIDPLPKTDDGTGTRPHQAPAATRFVTERNRMVDEQIASPRDGRTPVRDAAVLTAMRAVPRHAFVPEAFRPAAYEDSPLPIGEEQTISQPYIVALVTELLAVTPNSRVLEVGSGCGYQSAVLAEITPHVFGIEIVKPLFERAQRTLKEQGYTKVRLRHGDGYFGWKEAAPFDAIIVSCAAEDIPSPLWEQLRTGGRIVIPVGPAKGAQQLVVVTKTPDGDKSIRYVTGVRFVPLTGEGARRKE